VFNDLLALTEPDALHSYDELRWVILGRTQCGELLAVAHTRIESPNHTTVIRLISARRVTSRERLYYQSGGHMVQEDTDMQDEYDLSDAKRGVYYVEGQILNIPVYLDPQILRYFIDAAHKQGLETQELLNEILTQEIERRESAKSA
jgi:uncharacterized DUF497 family protein